MEGYSVRSSSISVPKNTGVEGFLKTLKSILSLRNVQNVSIDSKGNVSYTRYVREDEPDSPVSIDYSGLEPWNVIRNGDLYELTHSPNLPAPSVLVSMFNRVASEGLVPVALATGDASYFWQWHLDTAGLSLLKTNSAYGLPVLLDRQIPDDVLVMCASYVKGALVDCHRFVKITMSSNADYAETTVSIL